MNIENLTTIQQSVKETLDIRAGIAAGHKRNVLICGGTGCTSSGSVKIHDAMQKALEERGISDEVKVIQTGCFGLCANGPIMIVYPEGTFYTHVSVDDVDEIVNEHLVGGKEVERLLHKEKTASGNVEPTSLSESQFYKKQHRVALRNCGFIDPENIDEYIGRDGYRAIAKVLNEMEPQQVIDEMKKSGLRGRGGGGFPTGLKWQFAADQPKGKKYVVCNADEGDPGAFMDRSILEGDPHAIIEAMEIAGYAVGADEGYIYVRTEYPIAVHRLQVAIKQAHEKGLLGNNILGTDFNFDITLRLGAGAFVCGE